MSGPGLENTQSNSHALYCLQKQVNLIHLNFFPRQNIATNLNDTLGYSPRVFS